MSLPRNSIRTWALVAVGVTSIALIIFAAWLIQLLSSPDWCNRAIGAAEYAKEGRPEFVVSGCFSLLQQQVSALSINSFIALGTLALCLAVLVVIVLAGGKLSFKASREGIEGEVGKDVAQAADRVAEAAIEEAEDIKTSVEEEK